MTKKIKNIVIEKIKSEDKIENLKTKLNNTENKKFIWISIGITFLALSLFLSFIVYKNIKKSSQPAEPEQNQTSEQTEEKDNTHEGQVRRHIDGVYVEEGKENIHPFAVMIDNFPQARPQSGIGRANFIYEAEAEGGTTRFVAVFADETEIDEIGPVRSARPYFIDWSQEFKSLYIHVGGSPAGLAQLAKDDTFDMNQFYTGNYFWRDYTRNAPHNVYSSSDLIRKYLESKTEESVDYSSWKFKDDAELEDRGENGSIVKVHYQIKSFLSTWEYNQEENNYTKSLGNNLHKERSGEQIKAKNIAVQFVTAQVLDAKLRQHLDHIGSGNAVACMDGKCQEATWEKPSQETRTRYYDTDHNEIQWNAGLTWNHVVEPGYTVDY